jgi:Family of unknown function (DUF5941)
MSATVATLREPPAPADPLAVYRDDGLVGRALGRLGAAVPAPAPLLALAGLVPLVIAVVVTGGAGSNGLAAALLAWTILAVGVSAGGRGRRKIAWSAVPIARLSEYLALIWLAALHGESAYPAVYALLGALAFRHYDLVYRLRHRGVQPARWVSLLSLGWDGRLVLAYVLLVTGALPAGYFVVAGVLGAAFVGEAVYGWVVVGRIEGALDGDEEDDEL